jgi:protein O-mannosyl-transferase
MARSGKNRNSQASASGTAIAAGQSHAERGNALPAKQQPAAQGITGPAWLRLILPLAVVGITFLVFMPALHGGFLNWDDDQVLLQNDHFRGLGRPQLQWMAGAYWIGHYHPLTWLSFAIDYELWGLDENTAFGFHLTSVILHALNAGLFYLLARRLLAMVIPVTKGQTDAATCVAAALAALLFAIHPLRVESVAWVTERRDVLSVFFLLPCLLAYLKYATAPRRRWGWYAASIVLLLLSLLCKAWAMTLPAVLLTLDWYPLGRFRRQSPSAGRPRVLPLLIEKLPFVALATWAAYHAAQAQSSSLYTMKTLAEYGWLHRIAQGFYGIAFYLWKTLLPTRLVPIYEIPVKLNPLEGRFLVAAGLVVAITVVVLAMRRRWPAGLALWASYVVIVSPVLGLAQSGPQLVADRYSYVACMTWAILVAAGLLRLIRFSTTAPHGIAVLTSASIATAGVLATFGVLTWRQTCVWRDSETLWRYTLAVTPDSYIPHTNLAIALDRQGDAAAAQRHYQAALAVKPDGPEALTGLGGLLSDSGHPAEARPFLQRGLTLNPRQPTGRMNLAITLQRLGRYQEAVGLYREQLAADASSSRQAKLYTGLGGALGSLGKLPEAADCFRKAAALAPKDDLPPYNLGLALRQMGDAEGALQSFEAAVRLGQDIVLADPKALARTRLVESLLCAGESYAAKGDITAARERFRQALQLDPGHARARENLNRIEKPP